MTFFRSVFRVRQNLRPVLGHQYRVLELSGELAVLGADGPAISLVEHREMGADVDHGFHRETHAWQESVEIGLSIGVMRDRRVLVELAPDTMTDEFADDAETASMSFRHDRAADIRDATAGRGGFDAAVHAIVSGLRDRDGFIAAFANQEGFGLIAEPTVHDCCQIHIDDIARLQLIGTRNAVTDNFVNTCAAAFGKVVVAQCGGSMAVVVGVLNNNRIDLACRDAGFDKLPNMIHQLSVELARLTHRFTLVLVQRHLLFLLRIQHSFACPTRFGRVLTEAERGSALSFSLRSLAHVRDVTTNRTSIASLVEARKKLRDNPRGGCLCREFA